MDWLRGAAIRVSYFQLPERRRPSTDFGNKKLTLLCRNAWQFGPLSRVQSI
jgi:hypothetical protein